MSSTSRNPKREACAEYYYRSKSSLASQQIQTHQTTIEHWKMEEVCPAECLGESLERRNEWENGPEAGNCGWDIQTQHLQSRPEGSAEPENKEDMCTLGRLGRVGEDDGVDSWEEIMYAISVEQAAELMAGLEKYVMGKDDCEIRKDDRSKEGVCLTTKSWESQLEGSFSPDFEVLIGLRKNLFR
jgi:hypothetical protein